MLSRLRERVARFLAHRQDDWPNLVMAEFQWTSGLGLTEVTVERYLTGSSVRFAGSGFGLLVAEEVEANLGVYGYLSRRGDESDAQSVAWVLRRYLPERPVIELDPGDRAALAVATHNLSLALAEVVPEVMRIEREGGSAW